MGFGVQCPQSEVVKKSIFAHLGINLKMPMIANPLKIFFIRHCPPSRNCQVRDWFSHMKFIFSPRCSQFTEDHSFGDVRSTKSDWILSYYCPIIVLLLLSYYIQSWARKSKDKDPIKIDSCYRFQFCLIKIMVYARQNQAVDSENPITQICLACITIKSWNYS